MRRYASLLVCTVAALAVALSGSATASNGPSFGTNVDPSLVSTINGDSGESNGKYHVIVFGSPTLQAPDGGGWRNQLAGVGAVSATLTAAQIAQLSLTKGVQYVAPDVPMAPTGHAAAAVSAAELATLYPQTDGAPLA